MSEAIVDYVAGHQALEIDDMSLAEKLAAIMREIGVIPKTKRPGGPVYAFRSIDDIMNAVNPVFSKYKVTLNNHIKNYGIEFFEVEKIYNGKSDGKKQVCRAWVLLQLIFSDGILTEVTEEIAVSEDYGDKAYTQAMTMAFKSALSRKFCIPTADIDPDAKPEPQAQEVRAKKLEPRPENKPVIQQETRAKNQDVRPVEKPKDTPPVGSIKKTKKPLLVMDGNSYSKEWMNTVDAVKAGKVAIDQVKEVYELTPDVEDRLVKLIPVKK